MNTKRMLSIVKSMLQSAVDNNHIEDIQRLAGLVFLLQADYIRELERAECNRVSNKYTRRVG